MTDYSVEEEPLYGVVRRTPRCHRSDLLTAELCGTLIVENTAVGENSGGTPDGYRTVFPSVAAEVLFSGGSRPIKKVNKNSKDNKNIRRCCRMYCSSTGSTECNTCCILEEVRQGTAAVVSSFYAT